MRSLSAAAVVLFLAGCGGSDPQPAQRSAGPTPTPTPPALTPDVTISPRDVALFESALRGCGLPLETVRAPAGVVPPAVLPRGERRLVVRARPACADRVTELSLSLGGL